MEEEEEEEENEYEVKEVIDPEVADQRAYEESVMRQIRKDEEDDPPMALMEQTLRLKLRFRVN